MKSRRKLGHNLLMTEVVRILSNRFKPDPTHIKNRIESLIEKEYLERAESDRRLYLYKA
jgi:cullin 3